VFGDVQADWKVLTSILQPRVTKLTQIPEMIGFFKELPDYPADYFVNKKSKTNLENSKEMLRAAIDTLRALADWSVESLHETLLQLAQKLEVKNGTLLWPVRIAAAGQTVTPGGAMEILAILGKGESLKRLETGLEKLNS
ncbi:MAG TPA: glutamate--tRNA ligase, partial [Ruminococcaceae bacterium]|nr:glutamate--tRNA ligase [Oscillospiraceae bacterium]